MSRWAQPVLIFLTAIWGGTFLASQVAMASMGPFALLSCRFVIASLALGVLFWKRISRMTREEVLIGMLIGATAFAAFAFQTLGLLFSTSSKVGFITATYVPLVPLLQVVWLRKRMQLGVWLGVTLSFAGLAALAFGRGFGLALGPGEWLSLLGAIAVAFEIILIARYAPDFDPVRLSFVQLATVGVLALFCMPAAREGLPHFGLPMLGVVVLLGLVATAFTNLSMNWAQRHVDAPRATLIYALEPVFAGVFGAAAGEKFLPATMVGCGLIIAGILAGVFGTPFQRPALELCRCEGEGCRASDCAYAA